jgi:hypothetical protein
MMNSSENTTTLDTSVITLTTRQQGKWIVESIGEMKDAAMESAGCEKRCPRRCLEVRRGLR